MVKHFYFYFTAITVISYKSANVVFFFFFQIVLEPVVLHKECIKRKILFLIFRCSIYIILVFYMYLLCAIWRYVTINVAIKSIFFTVVTNNMLEYDPISPLHSALSSFCKALWHVPISASFTDCSETEPQP